MTRWHGGKGSKDRTTNTDRFQDNYDKIFQKDQRIKQQDMTELNGDGNRERGRYGEDNMAYHNEEEE